MRNPDTVLGALDSNAGKDDYKFDKLIRNFYNIEFFKKAYAKLYSKEGNMTKGSDGKTIDGFSLNHIEHLIDLIKTEKYYPEPVRRTHITKRNSKKLRPLGIPAFYDKLVQQVMVYILENIYEKQFSDYSHGYRENKSCHTALSQIKENFTGTKWWVEGDIKGFFDNIEHDILIGILRKKIVDEKFLRLVWKFLKAGYVYEGNVHKTYAGTPQGGVVSPILANIYLNELDQEMKEYTSKFSTAKRQRNGNSKYKLISEKISNRRKKLDAATGKEREALEEQLQNLLAERTKYRQTLPEGTIAEKDTTYKRFAKKIEKIRRSLVIPSPEERAKLIQEIKTLSKEQREIPSMDEFDPKYKRMKYVRYADDFLVSVIGTKQDAIDLKEHLTGFLREKLSLELSQEKTLITHNKKKVTFLGYDIFIGNREGKVKKVWNSGRNVRKRVDSQNVKLSLPYDRLKEFMLKNNYIKITNDGTWKAIHRPSLLTNNALEIVRKYNSEFSGFYQYYKLAFDVKEKLGSVRYLFELSFLRTLAGKHKTKVSKLRRHQIEFNGRKLQKYFVDGRWGVKYPTAKGKTEFAEIFPHRKIKVVKEPVEIKPDINILSESKTSYTTTSLIRRLNAGVCEWCGDTDGPFEVHHTRKLKDIKNKKSKRPWEKFMIYRNRKTMVLCGIGSDNNCHRKLHNGQLDNRPDKLESK